MQRAATVIATLSAALVTTPAHAELVSIAPSSQWNVDFAENKCRLARLFGEGDQKHLVFFEQYWPSDEVGLTVAGPLYKRFRSLQPTELKFFEAQPSMRTQPFTGTIGEFGPGVIYSSVNLETGTRDAETVKNTDRLPLLDPAFAQQVAFVSLKQRGDEIRLQTGAMDEAFAVLNQCSQSLVTDWGLDLEQHKTATRLPQWTNMETMVRRIQATYPKSALNRGEQGIMRLRLIVGQNGKVEECAIVKATDTVKLESPACKVMQDAVFAPALDATGQPMRSFYVTSITYRIG